ncbi:hypothetical protein G5I_09432 [Acromyrmex echinatior]|uniref:Uncharacterized protein n=1 Tax=Acromyrmex echinatior TaxID=103372 RepID=F4WU75_ACREC|nr:hypothetical protein G5I_09432 [Acromyrmex echinatior]
MTFERGSHLVKEKRTTVEAGGTELRTTTRGTTGTTGVRSIGSLLLPYVLATRLKTRATLIQPTSRQLSAYLQTANFRVTLLVRSSLFIDSTDESVSTVNKGEPVHPNASSGRERIRREIRCSWSTSCLTERHDGCNVCLRHGGQHTEQPGGRRRIINHGLGRQRVLFCGVLDEVYFRKRKNGRTLVEGDVLSRRRIIIVTETKVGWLPKGTTESRNIMITIVPSISWGATNLTTELNRNVLENISRRNNFSTVPR